MLYRKKLNIQLARRLSHTYLPEENNLIHAYHMGPYDFFSKFLISFQMWILITWNILEIVEEPFLTNVHVFCFLEVTRETTIEVSSFSIGQRPLRLGCGPCGAELWSWAAKTVFDWSLLWAKLDLSKVPKWLREQYALITLSVNTSKSD